MPKYISKKYETRKLGLKDPVIRLYPIVCWHIGAEQCDINFIEKIIARIKEDDNAQVIYLGDGGECVTKFSKGDVYKQLLNPQQQHDLLVELLLPIKDKMIFGVRGNHGNRIFKESGLSFDANLCHRLGIPYLGVSAFLNLVVNRSSYDLFFHHGSDSGTSLTSKISKAEKFNQFINADAIFTAHSHVGIELQPSTLYSSNNDQARVETKLRHQYICGCAYDSRSGYADEKGYSPLLPSHLVVQFDGRINNGHAVYEQKCEVIRADGSPIRAKRDWVFREDSE